MPWVLLRTSIIYNPGRLHLQLQLVRNQGDKLAVRRLTLGVGNRVTKESLQSIQIATIPGHLDSVPDGSFHPGRGGLEGLCHLGIQDLGDGVDGVPTAHLTATAATVFVDDL